MNLENASLSLTPRDIDRLMPMNLTVTASGHIGRVGPTLARLRPAEQILGRRFLEVFEIKRPRKIISMFTDLRGIEGANLRLQFRNGPPTPLKGQLVPLAGSGEILVNLSFGLSLIEAVQQYGLTNGDFSATDLAIEMLYLVEAKSAVMEESRKLNLRLQGARQEAEEQALSDALTGLRNRRAMDQVLARLTLNRTPFGLMHLDLDYFKAVNDTFGHAAGDQVLQFAANILRHETRPVDTVARAGGDEFVLIFEGLTDKKRLTAIANRIVKRLEEPVIYDGNTCRISGSIGFTTSKFYKSPDLDQMLSDVDVALYASKHKGRACSTMVTAELLQQSAAGGVENNEGFAKN